MAKYYLQWYRGATKKGSFSLEVPTSSANPWMPDNYTNVQGMTWAAFVTSFKQHSQYLLSLPQKNLFIYDDAYYQESQSRKELLTLFKGTGCDNVFDINQLAVGDIFYIGKQQSGSHITLASIDRTHYYFNYYCGDSTLAYQSVRIDKYQNNTRFGAGVLAWIGSLDNPGNYAINDFNVTRNNQYGFTLAKTNVQFLPTSVEAAAKFWGGAIPADEGNPYEGAGETEPGGGNTNKQNFDDSSDTVTADAMPTKGALTSGMVSVYSPTDTQVQNLSDLLFSYNFFDWLQKNLQNLEEIFVSFGVVPFTVTTGSSVSVTWLGFDISSFTHPVYLTTCAQQYYEIDMGSISLAGGDSRIHASDSVFDYSPFSKLGIYLPFIGFQELDIDECRGATIGLRYRVDVVSGSCVAIVSVAGNDIYQFSGNCLTQIPLGSVDMSGIVQGSIAIATAGFSAGATQAVASAGDAMVEGLNGENMSALQKDFMHQQNAARVSNANGQLASATANGVMGMKPNFKHSGAIGNSCGLFAVKQPYLFLTTPREAVPREYQKYCGLPCNITGKLNEFSGYTVVEDIRLNGLVATSSEVEEIYSLLKSGVII